MKTPADLTRQTIDDSAEGVGLSEVSDIAGMERAAGEDGKERG